MITDFVPVASVIIPCRGSVTATLREQLQALAEQDIVDPWELLIADNGITEDLSALLTEFTEQIPRIRVIAAAQRPGRSYAINLAVTETRSSRLITLDSDDVVTPSYLREMNDALSRHEFVGAQMDSASLNPRWLRGRRQPLQAVRLEPLLGRYTAVIGAAMALTRGAFDRVGGFDEEMLALEDLDISFRLHRAGIAPSFVPRAVVRYRYRRSYRAIFRQERTYSRHEALLYRKHRDLLAPRRLRRLAQGLIAVLISAVGVSTRTGRARFATNLGATVGRIEGSLRYGLRPS